MNEIKHHTYRSVVGSLLYLLKHSKPDLSNPIRELSRCMPSPISDNRKEMHRIIKWVINKKEYGLLIDPKCETDKEINII